MIPLSDELRFNLNRRLPNGELKPLKKPYFSFQDQWLETTITRLGLAGESFPEQWHQREWSWIGERIIEYPWLAYLLQNHQPKTYLDVGSVANHPILEPLLAAVQPQLFFLNPSPEPSRLHYPFVSLQGDGRSYEFTQDLRFDLISALSTLEHVGLDTRRYGGPGGETLENPDHPEQEALRTLLHLGPYLAPNGTIAWSVPYGPFEYLYDFGKPNLPIYYAFDASRLQAVIDGLKAQQWVSKVSIYKVIPEIGWEKTSMEDHSILPYGVHCPGAGAVALIESRKASPIFPHHR
jgi:hypothetical protein